MFWCVVFASVWLTAICTTEYYYLVRSARHSLDHQCNHILSISSWPLLLAITASHPYIFPVDTLSHSHLPSSAEHEAIHPPCQARCFLGRIGGGVSGSDPQDGFCRNFIRTSRLEKHPLLLLKYSSHGIYLRQSRPIRVCSR